jgi:hypothetical protein
MTTAKKPVSEQQYIELLEHLIASHGMVIDFSDVALEKEVFRALSAVENAFCCFDWRAYREWAIQWSNFIGMVWEPCEAWWDVEGDEPWIDEKVHA